MSPPPPYIVHIVRHFGIGVFVSSATPNLVGLLHHSTPAVALCSQLCTRNFDASTESASWKPSCKVRVMEEFFSLSCTQPQSHDLFLVASVLTVTVIAAIYW
jgi:hypothetical protein